MEYDQRVIIKFLFNERADACDIADREKERQTDRQTNRQTDKQTDCRHSLLNIFINYE
jgi:hypothetical protein